MRAMESPRTDLARRMHRTDDTLWDWLSSADRGPGVVFGVEGEGALRDVKAADEIGGRVGAGSRSDDLEHEGRSG